MHRNDDNWLIKKTIQYKFRLCVYVICKYMQKGMYMKIACILLCKSMIYYHNRRMLYYYWVKITKKDFDCLFVIYRPIREFSLIWKRHHCRWKKPRIIHSLSQFDRTDSNIFHNFLLTLLWKLLMLLQIFRTNIIGFTTGYVNQTAYLRYVIIDQRFTCIRLINWLIG